jgi:hypothetical protein
MKKVGDEHLIVLARQIMQYHKPEEFVHGARFDEAHQHATNAFN